MADYRPRAPLPGDDESGYDVWLPALVALIAAIVMVVMARADEPAAAAPRAIYDSRHFDEGAADREAAATAVARGDYTGMADAPAEPRRRLAGMARVDPVVLGRGVDEHLRIGLAGRELLIGRVLLDPGALFRHVGVSVFADPAGAGQKLVEAQHVEQRHLDHRAVDQVRPLGQHRPHEQPALRAAHDRKLGL